MRKIKIAYVDFWKTFDPEEFKFTKILRKHFEVEFDYNNPDYVFCSHFGKSFLKYNCVRILYLGEAKAPDFNVYDYAICFDDIKFGDRYLRYPYFLFDESNLNKALNKHLISDEELKLKKGFCSFVVSNNLADPKRQQFFEGLSKYKKVDSGGRYANNLESGLPVEDKLEFQKNYRFSFAFENSAFSGYTTEKIIDSFAAGTIPIYWGDPLITELFNEKSFINCNDMKSSDELIDVIKSIEEDDNKYIEMIRTPIATDGGLLEKMLDESYLEEFLLNIVNQDKEKAYRRNSAYTMWGRNYEHNMQQMDKLQNNKWFKKVNSFRKKLTKKDWKPW